MGQIHPSEVQQHLPVPVVGSCHRAISCFLFSPHATTVVSLHFSCNSRNTERGTVLWILHIHRHTRSFHLFCQCEVELMVALFFFSPLTETENFDDSSRKFQSSSEENALPRNLFLYKEREPCALSKIYITLMILKRFKRLWIESQPEMFIPNESGSWKRRTKIMTAATRSPHFIINLNSLPITQYYILLKCFTSDISAYSDMITNQFITCHVIVSGQICVFYNVYKYMPER